MSSGYRDIFINPQERAASSDINRLQRHKERDLSELLRYMLNVTGDDDSGAIAEYATLANPLRAEVINGVLVRPQANTFDLLVDPGVVMLLQPDAAADESDYKYCRDAGVSILGTLVIAPNASGSTRIDVVECRLSSSPGVVTDTRDVFDTSLGTFSATLVTKERYGVLEYRVRQGTPAAGFPGTASGWLPLCVASVPNGAASNNDVTFWDVRPLVSDRVSGPFSMSRTVSLYDQNLVALNDQDFGGELRVSGTMRVSYKDRWVGGMMRRGSPGTDGDYVDLLDVANQEDAYAIPVTGFSYLYLAFPFGLPRWSRYASFPSARIPRAPRGIPVLSLSAPRIGGLNDATIDLPSGLGLGVGPVPVGGAVCVAAVYATASTLRGGIIDGRIQWIRAGNAPPTTNAIAFNADGGYDRFKSTFTLIPGTHFPANAKALYCMLRLQYSITNGSSTNFEGGEIEVQTVAGSALAFVPGRTGWVVNGSGGTFSGLRHDTGHVRIPLFPEYPGSNVQSSKKLVWHYDTSSAGVTVSATPQCLVFGWEF